MALTNLLRRTATGFAVLVLVMVVSVSPMIATMSVLPEMTEESPVVRIDDALLDDMNSSNETDILLTYSDAVTEYKAKTSIEMIDSSARIIETFTDLNMLRVKLIGSSIGKLVELNFITNIWSNELCEVSSGTNALSPSVASNQYQPAIDLIGGRGLWEEGFNGTGVVIAVLDTGVDSTHADLDDFDDNASTSDTKVAASASFSEGDTLPIDIIGHGTYAASIAAGTGNSSEGLYAGIAPGATILSAKVTLGGLYASPSWIVSGIEWAASRGADIILLPFNTFGAPGDAVSVAVREAAEKGIFVVAAAGDDGPDYLTIMSPGGSAATFTVGAYDTEKQEIPDFSGRGPSLDLLTKPDIVAPGVGVVGAKMGSALESLGFGSFDLGTIGSLSGLLGGDSTGEDLDEYYMVDDTTTASASIVAGAAAILMQAFDRVTPIALGNVLRDTATLIPYGANDGGAGLLNLQAAFSYLRTKQEPINPQNRTTGTSQLALGIVTTAGTDSSTILLMSSYGTTVAAVDTRTSQDTSIHILMGMFALSWENRSPTNLMEFEVKSELHYTRLDSGDLGYNRMVGVLAYDEIYVVLLVESYNLTTYSSLPLDGLKVTPYILNLGPNPIDNVSLFLSYSLDLFSDGEDDHGKYSLGMQELFVYGQSEDLDSFYFGLNSSIPLSAFEIGNSSEVSSHISDDGLTGSTTFDGSVGLGMKWHFGELPVKKPANVSIAMGFGENRTVLDASILAQWEAEPPSTVTDEGDLIIVEADIPRVAEIGEHYKTRAVMINVGGNASQATGAFLVAKEEDNGLSMFSRVFLFDEVKPFHAEILTTTWSPEKMGINTAAWIAAPDFAIVTQLFLGTANIVDLINLLDNFLLRDVFVIDPISSTSVFPKQLPFAPFDIVFPADFGLYTFVVATTESLGNLTVQKYGNASDWGNATLPSTETVEGYYNFSLFLLASPITIDGYHRCDYVIDTDTGWTYNITLETSLRYPRAMMLVDTSHGGGLSFFGGFGDVGGMGDIGGSMEFPLAQDDSGGISLDSGFDLSSLGDLGDLTGLLDAFRLTTFSGLSSMKKAMANRGLDLVETPGIELDEDLLSQFSAVFVFSPTEEFNSTDVDMLRKYTRDGGKLIVLGDEDGTANLTGINNLISPFGYSMQGAHRQENTTDIISGTLLGSSLDSIWLGGGTYILGNQSLSTAFVNGKPVVLLDDSRPELALFGSSRIFMNKNLAKCNNSLLLDNLITYLLRNTLTGEASLAEDTHLYEAGKSVYLNLVITDIHGRPVNDLFVAIAFELPNDTLVFFIAGFVENGLYSSQFTPSYWKSAGRINGIFVIMGGENYANTYAGIGFELYEPSATTGVEPPFRLLTMAQIAMLAAGGIFGSLILGLVYNRRAKRKKMRIIEIEPELVREIDNTLNALLAAFTQIEQLIQREDLDRVQKIESLRGLMEGLEKGQKEFKKVSDRVGGV
ncbi:MAG: hypothetical protein EAX81_00765 [Candidatus Thorarchaeota archaeon]|nr:hypothetical protein [Candidatus Thorarchaeota archaeon]